MQKQPIATSCGHCTLLALTLGNISCCKQQDAAAAVHHLCPSDDVGVAAVVDETGHVATARGIDHHIGIQRKEIAAIAASLVGSFTEVRNGMANQLSNILAYQVAYGRAQKKRVFST